MPTTRLNALLEACAGPDPPFPPTELYQEKWLLRLVLDWLAAHPGAGERLSFADGARWFSEAYLPSAFHARRGYKRRDPLAESRSHADGVVGHFTIGATGKADLALAAGATRLKVLEAKIYSPLSPGVANVPYYDQAARSVACDPEVLRRAGRDHAGMTELSFLVLAPQRQIDAGRFPEVDREAVRRKVRRRVDDYVGTHDGWFRDWFEPTLAKIDLGCIGWESVRAAITAADPAAGRAIGEFHDRCLRFCARRGEDAE